eukprot:TRINITY_DN2830_c0_g1_i3.p2 TRINITY_DN2830_c0_g1~~TRINITY_DN2830_c0_g1_i3.p2  ORF type:complete len:105 (-),score=10.70 TRINITY_DN2830_c0_g1_i3:282-596(-)
MCIRDRYMGHQPDQSGIDPDRPGDPAEYSARRRNRGGVRRIVRSGKSVAVADTTVQSETQPGGDEPCAESSEKESQRLQTHWRRRKNGADDQFSQQKSVSGCPS